MKVEIKKIGVLKVIFSVFPVAIFVVMLLAGFLGVFSPETTVNVSFIMNMIIQAIISTILFLVFAAVFVFTYNVLTGIGIRGVVVELEDKE